MPRGGPPRGVRTHLLDRSGSLRRDSPRFALPRTEVKGWSGEELLRCLPRGGRRPVASADVIGASPLWRHAGCPSEFALTSITLGLALFRVALTVPSGAGSCLDLSLYIYI